LAANVVQAPCTTAKRSYRTRRRRIRAPSWRSALRRPYARHLDMLEKWQQSTYQPTSSRRRQLLVVLLGGGMAALVMLGVGLAFNQLESLFPAIQLEYENKAVFRIWPDWSESSMLAHPCWFGVVFALVYVLVSQDRVPTSRGR